MAAGSIVIDLLMKTGSFETDTDRATKKLKGFQAQATDTAASVGAAFGAIAAAGASAFALINFAEFGAKFQDLGQKLGDTAASVAALTPAAATSNTAIEEVVAASIKLTKAMSETNDATDKTALALKSIGIDFRQFAALTPTEKLKELGKAFNEFADGEGKTAVATALLGKSGAQLIPFLHDLGEQQASSTKLTNEQIAALDKFTDAIALAREETKTLGAIIASNVIPPIQELLDTLKDSSGKVAAFTAIGEAIRTAFEAIVVLGSDVAFVFKGVGREIAAVAAQIVALASLDIPSFRAISNAVKEDGERARKELDEFQKRILTAQGLSQQRAQALALTSGLRGPLDANDARATRTINFKDTSADDKKGEAFLERLKRQAAALEQNEFASLRIEAAQLKVAAAAEPFIKRLEQAKGLQESIKLFVEDIIRQENEAFAFGDLQVSLSKQSKEIEFQIGLVGKNADEVARLTAAWQLEQQKEDAARGKSFDQASKILNLYDQETGKILANVDALQKKREAEQLKQLTFGFGEEIKDIESQTNAIGKTREQVELLTAARQLDKREAQDIAGKSGDALAATEEAYKHFRAQVLGSIEDQQRVAHELLPLINTANQFGQTIASSFEDAIVEGKKFSDVLKALAQDLERILLRQFVTNNFADILSGAFKGLAGIGAGTGSGTGQAPGESTGSFTGRASAAEPQWAKAAGMASSVAITYNIDASGNGNQDALRKELKASEQRTKAAIVEARTRDPQYSI